MKVVALEGVLAVISYEIVETVKKLWFDEIVLGLTTDLLRVDPTVVDAATTPISNIFTSKVYLHAYIQPTLTQWLTTTSTYNHLYLNG